MADQRYYPYLPWNDDPIEADPINHPLIHADWLSREGIYGPYPQVFRWLSARDNKMLIADTRIIGTLQTA